MDAACELMDRFDQLQHALSEAVYTGTPTGIISGGSPVHGAD